ncbi:MULTISPECIES: hypothetical protein [Paenibacillus]|uniref:hypothetical protein n=1 Tax=Paenibacillus TaxID=44249 RepID=UPI0007851FC6|nr:MULTISPECIES: hypothetical protein [Paenibacillus]MCL6661997.1 hypothetical protein [Paenibacillus amylolyticus]MEC0125500.1 hypothetical protein [Paenibacillus pabuli]
MIYGFELRKLRIIGNDEKVSEVSFKSGLNVIAGPSNTGKTYIFECINFMLGGTELPEPIDEAKEYHTVQLEIISRNNQVYTLERGLTGGKVKKYNSAISEIESNSKFTELAQKHAKKESVSSFLMKLSGFINTELFVIKNKGTKETQRFSYRSFNDYILINEVEIISKNSPIQSKNNNQTAEESIFKLIISNKDDSVTRNTVKTDNQNGFFNAQIDIINKLILDIEAEIKLLELPQSDHNLSEDIEQLLLKRSGLSSEIETLTEKRKIFWENIQSNESRLLSTNQLIKRFYLLKEQYETDIKRLSFLIEGDHYFSMLDFERCPHCNQLITNTEDCDHVEIKQRKDSYTKELLKINSHLKDLNDALESMEGEKALLLESTLDVNLKYEEISIKLDEQLSPKILFIQEELTAFLKKQKNIIEYSGFRSSIEKLMNERELIASKLVLTKVDEQNQTVEMDYTGLIAELCVHIQRFLTDWNFPDSSTVDFDPKNKDVLISGKARRLFGKGYRSISYGAFIIGLMEYCISSALPHPGFVVLDSPVTSYKEQDENEDKTPEELQNKFFEELAQTKRQVIILENKKPPISILKKINYIEFTKNKEVGRYGFFNV